MMAKQIFKSILIGVLVGAALFMAPFFLLKFFLFLLIIGAIFKLIWGGKRHRWSKWNNYAYADHIRNMSEEEYKNYKEKWHGHHCGPNHFHGHFHRYNYESKQESKTDKTEE